MDASFYSFEMACCLAYVDHIIEFFATPIMDQLLALRDEENQ